MGSLDKFDICYWLSKVFTSYYDDDTIDIADKNIREDLKSFIEVVQKIIKLEGKIYSTTQDIEYLKISKNGVKNATDEDVFDSILEDE